MFSFTSIAKAIEDITSGKMIIVTDDEDRENEGDLVMAAQKITPEAVNFMATHARGLICTSINQETANRLKLEPMVMQNTAHHETAFTVSVDASEGVTTGISTHDRARTISLLADEQSKPESFARPGHIFPLIAKDGGVLVRPGHTEASVDLAQHAHLHPSGVICEIMNHDGSMARLPDLIPFARKHDLSLINIKDLIAFKKGQAKSISYLFNTHMPTHAGDFTLHVFQDAQELSFALTKGSLEQKSVLTRIHSECFTGELFHSKRCECAEQLHKSMQIIEQHGSGIILELIRKFLPS